MMAILSNVRLHTKCEATAGEYWEVLIVNDLFLVSNGMEICWPHGKKRVRSPFALNWLDTRKYGIGQKKQILPTAYWSIESRGTSAIKCRMRQCINIYNIENETAIITIYQTFPITVTYCCCSALHPLHLIPSFTFGVFSSVEIVSSGSSSHHFYFDSKILLRFLFSRRDIV